MTNVVTEHVAQEHLDLVGAWLRAGRITPEQHVLLLAQTEALLTDDPYWPECPNVWDGNPHARQVFLVVAYHKSRRYGGPEEGGWWYDHLDPLTDHYAQVHGRSFTIAGPFSDSDDAWEVARDLSAFEHGRSWADRNIVWRVISCLPTEGQRAVYC